MRLLRLDDPPASYTNAGAPECADDTQRSGQWDRTLSSAGDDLSVGEAFSFEQPLRLLGRCPRRERPRHDLLPSSNRSPPNAPAAVRELLDHFCRPEFGTERRDKDFEAVARLCSRCRGRLIRPFDGSKWDRLDLRWER